MLPPDHQTPRKALRLRSQKFPRAHEPQPPPTVDRDEVTNVREILRVNAAHDERHQRRQVLKARTRRARGRGAFFTLLVAGNGAGLAGMWRLPQTTSTMLIVAAGMMLFTLVLSRVMFVSRDDD